MGSVDFSLHAVYRADSQRWPLVAEFMAYDKEHRFWLNAAELQSFDRFQAAVLERCGVWLPKDEILSTKPRDAKQEWSAIIQNAVCSGEKHQQ